MKTAQRTKSVLIYYFVACLWSWPFFWIRDIHPEIWESWAVKGFLKNWALMWGPAIGALVVFSLYRKTRQRRITVLGSSKFFSFLFYLLPIVFLSFFGYSETGKEPSHLAALIVGLVGFVSTFGEELGWRGFLQDALHEVHPAKKYILIGVMWEFWHFTNRTHEGTLQAIFVRLAIFYAILIFVSFILGVLVERTRSVVVAVTLHLWINLTAENGTQIIYPLLLSLVTWAILLWRWPKAEESSHLKSLSV